MEDEIRKFNEKKVHELVSSLKLNKYRHLRRKPQVEQNVNGTLVEKNDSDEDEEDSGTFICRGTVNIESDNEDQGTFIYRGTLTNSSDSDKDGTVTATDNCVNDKSIIKGKQSNTGKNLQEDLVAATLLNRKNSQTDDIAKLTGEDLTALLRKNPKDAATQIVQGLKKSLSYEDKTVEEVKKEEKQVGFYLSGQKCSEDYFCNMSSLTNEYIPGTYFCIFFT